MKLHDKKGNEVTGKEFMQRWKQGMQKVTALQLTRFNLIGNILVLIGVLIGIYSTFITKTWWLVVILVGSLFLSVIALIGAIQKYIMLKTLNKKIQEIKGGTEYVG